MKVRMILGKLLYPAVKYLPASYALGGSISKFLRYHTGKLIMNKCGKNVNIEKGAYFTRLIEVGNNSGLGINSYISGKVIIGNDVMMAPNVSILTVNHNFMNKNELIAAQGSSMEKPVVIGNDVWIGMNVMILPGVHIADGSVIGAGAVVTKDTEPYSIVAGNPAKIVKYRN